ncbi:MAG: serine/threonine-protein kinase [Halioglobus sp.]
MADFELPGYELYERLGRGGMATVYRALHLNLDREVAIKVMDPSMSSDENFSERFIREARISARLTHPHILQIYDVNTFDGYNYIAMELLGAGELSDFIHAEMPQKQIYLILRHMTEALDYAAGSGYVHRDIKPSNIMLRDTEDFVLADFGIARAANSGTQMTQTGLMVGTPSYMSPEQAKGQEVDGRSDLYALAVLAYEMLTKTLPYESESAVTTAVKHLTEDIPTLPEHLSAYQDFINKGLAKAADDRFQTGEEMFQAFKEASAGFADDQVLTEGLEPPKVAATGAPVVDESQLTSMAGVESTRLSHSSSPAVSASSSRPYRLEGSTQRERLVSGTFANNDRSQKKSGGSALRMLVIVAVLAAAGFGGYTWLQAQQGGSAKDQRAVTAELAQAFSAMNEEDLPLAASSFYKVLSMDGGNNAAQQGMEEVGVLYTAAIEKAIAEKDSETARQIMLDYGGYFSSNSNFERLQAEIELLSEEENLASVHAQRVQKFLSQVDASVEVGDFDQAYALTAQAAAIDPEHPGLEGRRSSIEQAQTRSADYEQRWSRYTPAQRDEFQAFMVAADEALNDNDLEAAAAAVENAGNIAADAPELTRRVERLETARAQVAQNLSDEQARVDALLDEADAAASSIAADPSNAVAALAIYQEIAARYPDNPRVKKGMAAVTGFYTGVARDAAKDGDFESAQQALASAESLLPGSEEVAKMQANLPAMEQVWADQQAAVAQRREEEQAARAQAEETAGAAERSIGSGALDIAQQAYDEVVKTHPGLPAVKALGNNLRRAYGDAARSQIELKEFDQAQEFLAQGASHFPDDPAWNLLEEEIETARTSSRRRLGAY